MTISFRKLGNASDLRKWKDWAASTIRQSFLNSGKFLLWPKQVWIFFLAKAIPCLDVEDADKPGDGGGGSVINLARLAMTRSRIGIAQM